ncbi:hypothetical protein ACROYT_G027265 [Oculina patagonica]
MKLSGGQGVHRHRRSENSPVTEKEAESKRFRAVPIVTVKEKDDYQKFMTLDFMLCSMSEIEEESGKRDGCESPGLEKKVFSTSTLQWCSPA